MLILSDCAKEILQTKNYSLTQLKVELGCLNSADAGATIHTSAAMNPVEMSKIILIPLITLLFIADTVAMAPICVRMLGFTPMQT